MQVHAKLLGVATLALVASAAPAKGPSCDESCLLGLADEYMSALAANDISTVPFAANVKTTENGSVSKPGDGVWTSVKSWTYRHTIVDPASGGIVILGVANEGEKDGKPKQSFLTVRLKVAANKVTEAEHMVARDGDFGLFVPNALNEPNPIFTAFVPSELRSTRKELESIARSYFDALAFGDPKKLKFHPDCNRMENGGQTTNSAGRLSSSCSGLEKFTYMHKYRQTRFPVIDTARGLVLGITAFDLPLQERTILVRGKPFEINAKNQKLPRTLFLYELFKVEGGRVRMIEAQMRNMPLGSDMGWGGEAGNENPIP